MKKRLFSALSALILCFIFVMPAFAIMPRNTHIVDNVNIFSDSEFNELEGYALSLEEEYGYFVMFCLTDVEGDGATYEFGQTTLESNSYCDNGIALTHNIKENVFSFNFIGEAEEVLSEDIQNKLWGAYNETETYYDGVIAYFDSVDAALKSAGVTNEPLSENVTLDPNLPTERLLPLVVDKAELLTDAQETELITRLTEISDKYELDLAVLTVNSFEGKSPEAFADDFYDYNGYGRGENADGALLVYKPGAEGDRRLQISTCGKAIDALNDSRINSVINDIKQYFIDEDYLGGFMAFSDECESAFEMRFNPSVSLFWIPVCLIIGFVISFGIMKASTSSLKSVRHKADAGDYASSVNIIDRSDVFLYRNVDKVRIQSESSSSGSSTHTSSSGRTHGGGGASF